MCPECLANKKASLPVVEPEPELEPEEEIEQIEPVQADSNETPDPNAKSSKTLIVITVLLYILIATTSFYLFWPKTKKQGIEFALGGDQLLIRDQSNQSSLVYNIEEPLELYGRILSFNPHKPSLDRGASFLELIFLDDQDYQKYLSEYMISQHDPSNFLKQTARWIFLISDDENFRSLFSVVEIKGGETFELKGYELSLKQANIAGKTAQAPNGPYQLLLPTSLTIEGKTVEATTFSQYPAPKEQTLPPTIPQEQKLQSANSAAH